MNPSDTQIERMAETFAERTPFLRRSRDEAKAAWQDALEIGREDGTLEQIEQRMHDKQLVDLPVNDAWERARAYGPDGAYDPYADAPTEP
jgi:hypothetical protein